MENQFIIENKRERERLEKLVAGLTDEELNLVIYKEGWTVAVILAHLAFWDRWSLLLMEKWKKSGVVALPMGDWDTINDTLFPNDVMLPFLLAIPPRVAANMAVSSAKEIDKALEDAPLDMITKIGQLSDRTRLYRSIHRKMHLDEIENLLKSKRGSR
jgi:hypothetical protein